MTEVVKKKRGERMLSRIRAVGSNWMGGALGRGSSYIEIWSGHRFMPTTLYGVHSLGR